MSWDHDRVDELLAGYVLGGLDDEDAELAARALIEHVPDCHRCRRSLEGYRVVAGDIGLAAPPVTPPDVLGTRIRREVSPGGRGVRRGWGAAAIAAAALIGMSGWNAFLVDRMGDAELEQQALTGRLVETEKRQKWLAEAVSTSTHPKSSAVPMAGAGKTRVVVLYVPGDELAYVIGTQLPPPDGSYVVWFMRDGDAWTPGTLEPLGDVGIVRVETDPESWERVMITEEPTTDTPTPTASPVVLGELVR